MANTANACWSEVSKLPRATDSGNLVAVSLTDPALEPCCLSAKYREIPPYGAKSTQPHWNKPRQEQFTERLAAMLESASASAPRDKPPPIPQLVEPRFQPGLDSKFRFQV